MHYDWNPEWDRSSDLLRTLSVHEFYTFVRVSGLSLADLAVGVVPIHSTIMSFTTSKWWMVLLQCAAECWQHGGTHACTAQ